MLIRFALWMMLLCLPLFLLAKALLIFTFIVFAALATKLAAFLLLTAFGLLIFAAFFGTLQRLWHIVRRYFSAAQRNQRQCLFVQNKNANQKRLFYFQRLQLTYFKERQRKKILEQNDQQHINALSNAIKRDLQGVKSQLSKENFVKLQRENRRYRMQQNEQALLELHHKISKLKP